MRWDVTHTLVVATQTVNAPDLVERLIARHREIAAPLHLHLARAPATLSREEVCDRLAATLAALYREEIDATGQPMSPEPFAAVRNAVEHYRVDDILISTFAGRESKWIEEGLLEQVNELTDKPVEHFESGGDDSAPTEPARAGRRARARRGGGRLMESASIRRRRRARPRRPPSRPARGARVLEDRPPDARHPALHRLRGDAVRGVLRLLLLPPRGLQPGRRLAARGLRAAESRRRHEHRDPGLLLVHRSTGRSRAPARATATR